MKKYIKVLIIGGYIGIVLFSALVVFLTSRSYTVYLENPTHSAHVTLEHEQGEKGVLEISDIVSENGISRVRLKALKSGKECVKVTLYPDDAGSVKSTSIYTDATVTRGKMLLVNGYDFEGYKYIYIGLALAEFLTALLVLSQFIYRTKHNFFNYKSVLDLSLGMYLVIRGWLYIAIIVGELHNPSNMNNYHMYSMFGFMTSLIVLLSLPVLFVFSMFLIISNLSLIRHEGFAKNNLLGIFISAFMGLGALACLVLFFIYPNSLFMRAQDAAISVARNSISGVFVYFLCMLISAQICCIYSAVREPQYNKDFIIILGCKIRDDGTPLPLLRGRVDRALRFYRTQLEKTGKQARFIPSGGQGADEVISEAESMRRYLMEQGIDESLILPESRATTTLENMRFSAEIAQKNAPEEKAPNLVFSTTNYHVFRSGILSRKAGLKAAGIGAKTKWYFWPNAQIREFVGLLVSEYKINLLVIAGIAVNAALFAHIGMMIEWIL